MNTGRSNSVADVGAAHAALMDLCRPFAPPNFMAECEAVPPDAVAPPSDALLVHQNHMTLELERFHGKPVAVQVLEEHLEGELYTRKIGLTLIGTSRVVEWGICRLNFRHLSQQVREEVLAKKLPLGAVLIRNKVHRRIEPRFFLRFGPSSSVIKLFGVDYAAPVYGRLGTIFCEDEPAIEVLEIVVNTEVEKTP